MSDYLSALRSEDPVVYEAVLREAQRQNDHLELIASENFVSRAVLDAVGSVLTNKYAEGYPSKRYYGGCEFVDVVENVARERALQLFGGEHANVQPHSGAQANMAAYFAVMQPGDTLLGMNLSHGGHLTHGSPANFSGKLYRVVAYGVREDTGRIDYDEVREIARREKPKVIMAGASAYPRVLDFAAFADIAREVGAVLIVDMAHIAGLVAAGEHPNPVPHAEIVTSTAHKTLRGPRSGFIICREAYAKPIDKEVFPGMQGGPLMHVIAGKAVAFGEALKPAFKDYARQIILNAQALAETLVGRGYKLVSGGTDNHLMLVSLLDKGELSGKAAEAALGQANITVNKNTVPGETRSPFVTSGIRVGTAALTTRGMKVDAMRTIGGWMADVLDSPADEERIDAVRAQVLDLCASFPIYPEYPAPGA